MLLRLVLLRHTWPLRSLETFKANSRARQVTYERTANSVGGVQRRWSTVAAASREASAPAAADLHASISSQYDDDIVSTSGREEQEALRGGLYLVSTPLGNLADFSSRAVSVLRQSDLVLAENPKHSRVLLQHWGVTGVPVEAFHQHNERKMESRVLDLLARGSVVSLISDAGTPAISDPGAGIVRAAAEARHLVTTVPGPTALISALIGSGLSTTSFTFLGFLPPKAGARRRQLESVQGLKTTLLFYVAPHDLLDVLTDAVGVLGPSRRCCVARELTKIYEEYYRATLQEAREEFEQRRAVKGEIVLVIEGAGEPDDASDEEVLAALQQAGSEGQSPSQAAKSVAAKLQISRKRVYALSLQLLGTK